jgi:small subunit ribosomal protein S8
MPLTDPLGDMLTRIRNGQQARKDSVVSPASKLRVRVLDELQREGYIRGYSEEAMGPAKGLRIELKYFEGQPAIQHLSRISKPGRRVYSGSRSCRAFATASALPSSRRHAAFSRMRKRASRMLAARCWRRYSDVTHW